MQGRPGRGNESWDRERSATAKFAALNGTGKQRAILQGTDRHKALLTSTSEHRAIPQRPPHLRHVNSPPETPRVPRPQRLTQPPKKTHRLIIIMGAIVAVIAIIAFVIVFLLINAINQGTGPAMVTTDFLSSLSSKNYNDAYKDLGPAITIRLNQQTFTQQAQAVDQQFGEINNYSEVNSSATVNSNNTESFTYTITRSKMTKTYNLTITLQQDTDDNAWKIVDYGTTLGPNS
jgi:flagellar basal body-associated protein FliL